MVKIAEQHPETREQSIAAIAHQLEQFTKNNPVLNGMLVAALLDLKAVEAAPVMERAFAANRVDETIAGDWEEVQLDLWMVSKLELRQRRFEATKRPVVDFSSVANPNQKSQVLAHLLLRNLRKRVRRRNRRSHMVRCNVPNSIPE
ncbi:hypothetical protein H6F68_11635 [Trichocoleus sp. FACHB-262]|nr:hypothetical protein [Trichocoleus sp. FACHB-262]